MGGSGLLNGAVHHLVDVGIALIGHNAFGIIVQLGLAIGNVLFQMRHQIGGQVEFLLHLGIALKQFDRIPAQETGLHMALNGFLNVRNGVLYAAGKHMGLLFDLFFALGQCQRSLGGLHAALAFQGAHFHHRAAQALAELGKVQLVAVFAHQIHHVDSHQNGNAKLDQLRGQIQVALNIGAIHDVQDGIGLFTHQIFTRNHFLQGVGRKRINAGQVLNDHIVMTAQLALLLFNSNAGPVTNILAAAGQLVEQGGFAAVRVARQCNFKLHAYLLSKS